MFCMTFAKSRTIRPDISQSNGAKIIPIKKEPRDITLSRKWLELIYQFFFYCILNIRTCQVNETVLNLHKKPENCVLKGLDKKP